MRHRLTATITIIVRGGVIYIGIDGQEYSAEAWEAGDGPTLHPASVRCIAERIELIRSTLDK